jgi:hypothetical protein
LAGAFFAAEATPDVTVADAAVLAGLALVAARTGAGLVGAAVEFVAVCAGMALFEAFRTAFARSAMAFPHTCKTGARRGAAHSEDGKNTEPTVPRQTCHT